MQIKNLSSKIEVHYTQGSVLMSRKEQCVLPLGENNIWILYTRNIAVHCKCRTRHKPNYVGNTEILISQNVVYQFRTLLM
jgi:hypothetical protein